MGLPAPLPSGSTCPGSRQSARAFQSLPEPSRGLQSSCGSVSMSLRVSIPSYCGQRLPRLPHGSTLPGAPHPTPWPCLAASSLTWLFPLSAPRASHTQTTTCVPNPLFNLHNSNSFPCQLPVFVNPVGFFFVSQEPGSQSSSANLVLLHRRRQRSFYLMSSLFVVETEA